MKVRNVEISVAHGRNGDAGLYLYFVLRFFTGDYQYEYGVSPSNQGFGPDTTFKLYSLGAPSPELEAVLTSAAGQSFLWLCCSDADSLYWEYMRCDGGFCVSVRSVAFLVDRRPLLDDLNKALEAKGCDCLPGQEKPRMGEKRG